MKDLGSRWSSIRCIAVCLMMVVMLGCQGLQYKVLPSGLFPLTPALNFGNVKVGSSKALSDTFQNGTGYVITVTQVSVTGSDFKINSPSSFPFNVYPGQGFIVSVTFQPQGSGQRSANVAITSQSSAPQSSNANLSTGDAFLVPIRSNGAGIPNGFVPLASSTTTVTTTTTLPVSGTADGSGQLLASPTSLAFGNAQVGTSQTLSETLTNSTGSSLTISQASAAGNGFSVTGLSLPLTLNSGQSTSFSVKFAPSSAGSVSGNVAIVSNASNPSLNVPLSGTGVTPGTLTANPSSLSFGSVQTGSSSTLSETISNSGGSSVTVSQANVTGTGFSLTGLSLPLTLNAGQSTSFSVKFAPSTAGSVSGNVAIISDASNPTVNVGLSGVGLAPGALSGSPSSLSFGSVQTGSSSTLSETITNSGGSSVTVSQANVTGTGFSVTGLSLPLTLNAGQSTTFSVKFAPSSAGSASGNVAVVSNASNPTLNVPLSGTGVTPGTLTANPSSLTFGSVQTGSSATLSETVTNSGGSAVTISQANLTGTGFSVTGLSLPLTLNAGQSTTFSVKFAPSSGGSVSGNVAVVSNASNPTLNVPLSGTGVSPGTLAANPTSLSFGSVQTGGSSTLSETITNSGGASVTVSQANVTGTGFSLTGLSLPLTLNAGQSTTFSVKFAPSSAGSASGNVALVSNASNPTLNITLSGIGVAPALLTANPSPLAFGNVPTGSNSTLSETVTNTGGSAATISQVAASGTGFSFSGVNPPVTLSPNQSATFSVIFAPQSSGSASGSLVISSNASNPSLSVSLTGTGTAPGQLAVTPSSLSFGSVDVGTSQSQSATLNATGAAVTVTSVGVSGSGFSVSGISLPTTIPAGNSASFTVTFAPQASGSASANVTFTSNASNSPTVQPVSGTGAQHNVALTWNASTSGSVVGYNVYRGIQHGGPYVQINSALDTSTSYSDGTVQGPQTYYYVVTAVDSNSQESLYSNEAQAIVP